MLAGIKVAGFARRGNLFKAECLNRRALIAGGAFAVEDPSENAEFQFFSAGTSRAICPISVIKILTGLILYKTVGVTV